MAEMAAQAYLASYYEERAEQRGNHARRSSGNTAIEYAEAFQRVTPQVVSALIDDSRAPPSTRRPAVAGRRPRPRPGRAGLARRRPGADGALRPGRQPDGPRRRRRGRAGRGARADDAGAAAGRAGRRPARDAGEGPRGRRVLVDAAVRDVEELRELGLPVWARWMRVRGADKRCPARSASRSTVGGAAIRQGDVVVLDADGVVVVERERVDEVLAAAARAPSARSKAREAPGGRSCPTTSTGCARSSRMTEPSTTSRASATRSCSRRSRRRACVLHRRPRDGGGGARGTVGLPARLGRLPPVQPEADRVAARRARAHRRSAPGAPRRSSGASPRSRRPASARAGSTATSATAPRTGSRIPTATVFELYYEAERYAPPEHCGRRGATSPSATRAAARA